MRAARGPALAAIGLEAEFSVVVDGQTAKPEHVFGSPTTHRARPDDASHRPILPSANGRRDLLRHRRDRDRHAVDRDRARLRRSRRSLTLGKHSLSAPRARRVGSASRVGPCNWSGSARTTTSRSRSRAHERGAERSVGKLAKLLTHIVPIPMMLLAANRRSTGIGVRPRGDRVEDHRGLHARRIAHDRRRDARRGHRRAR